MYLSKIKLGIYYKIIKCGSRCQCSVEVRKKAEGIKENWKIKNANFVLHLNGEVLGKNPEE